MRYIATFLTLLLLMASSANTKPEAQTNTTMGSFQTVVTWVAGDGEDSDLIPVGGKCSLSFTVGGSDVVGVYQVPTAATAAQSGTLVETFSATTQTPTVVFPAQLGLKAVATTPTAGGSILTVRCSNVQVGDGNLDLGTGTIRGHIASIVDDGATVNMEVATHTQGMWNEAGPSGAAQWNLPDAVLGDNFCLLITTAQVVSMNPDSGDIIVVPTSLFTPALDTDDELDSGGTLGELACFWAYEAGKWFLLGFRGSWVDGGAT